MGVESLHVFSGTHRNFCLALSPNFAPGSLFVFGVDRLRVGEVSRGEKRFCSGTDPESYMTEDTSVYED